jgi:hypothetical protein
MVYIPDARKMNKQAIFRTLLVLTIVTAHVAGATAAVTPSAQSTDAIYFCCCLGECSCTADCCNHDPGIDVRNDLGYDRVGPATPALQSQKNCGIWLATPQRSPEQPSAAWSDAPQWLLLGPDQTDTRNTTANLVPSNEGCLRDFSPRAPPADKVLS